MTREWLECLVCGARRSIGPMFAGCEACCTNSKAAPLEVRYDYASIRLAPDESAPGIWRWHQLLPGGIAASPVSLLEGNTPLCQLKSPNEAITLLLKNESVNPTWSYKDRSNSVNISMAHRLGFQRTAAVSTGNHGSSHAAYATAGGLQAVVFCHQEVSALQTALMQLYGACVLRGGNREGMLGRLVRTGAWFPSCIIDPFAGTSNPYGVEGFKTLAFEIFFQLGRQVPDRVFVPVGSGDGLYGIWKGFVELTKVGLADRLPKMIGCQAEGAAPYVRSFSKGSRQVEHLPKAETVALSISEVEGGRPALWAIYESAGEVLAVPDEAILWETRRLARAGYALEPASAAALACAERLFSTCTRKETWVLIGTGSHVKWAETLTRPFEPLPVLPPEFDRVEEALNIEKSLGKQERS